MALAAASAMTVLAVLALLGWLTPWRGLASVHRASVPMAPSTVLGLGLMGAVLMLDARRRAPRLASGGAAVVAVLAAIQIAFLLASLPSPLDRAVASIFDVIGIAAPRPMSLWTAISLLGGSAARWLSRTSAGQPAKTAAWVLAFAVCLVSGLTVLGYRFGARLLYGGDAPHAMAFPTALAIGCLGLALVGLMPREKAWLRPFTGSSTKAMMLRGFLPVAPAVILVELLFERLAAAGMDPAVETVLTAVTAGLIVAGIVFHAARGVSRELDAAQAERERALRDADLAAIVQSSTDAIYAIRPDGTIKAWNDSAERLYGYSRDEALGRSARMLVPPDAVRPDGDSRERVLAGLPVDQVETLRLRKDGSRVLVLVSESPLRDTAGRVVGLSVIAHDVGERRRSERALLESEERFRQIADNITQVFWLTNPAKNEMLYVSPAYAQIWQRDPAALLASPQSWMDAIHPDDRARVMASAVSRQATGEYSEEYRIVRPDGSIRWIWDRAFPVRDSRGEVSGIAGLAEDITERKATEQRLRQAQKLEAVGRLAGGVAHDFNNSLGVILGYTELLLRQATETQRGKLEHILEATHRSASLTRQLLAFSRKQVVDPKLLDLNAVLAELETMVRRLIGEGIDLALVTGAELGLVKVDPSQLEQVVMNLCLNAADAMAGGGSLRIETANAELGTGDREAPGEPVAPGRYVMLSVADTGSGIEKETLGKLFEPFFTTKERGRTAGLGLATVYGIVKQAGGGIGVESEVGRGTTFRIYLPRMDESAVPASPQPRALSAAGVTILLVEDENALRAIAREMLEDEGYRVLEAASPSEALALARRHAEPIHLLVTDMVMPGMNGRALAEALRTARPDLKILFVSGYSDDIIAEHGVLEPGTDFLAKPFTSSALRERVRSATGADR